MPEVNLLQASSCTQMPILSAGMLFVVIFSFIWSTSLSRLLQSSGGQLARAQDWIQCSPSFLQHLSRGASGGSRLNASSLVLASAHAWLEAVVVPIRLSMDGLFLGAGAALLPDASVRRMVFGPGTSKARADFNARPLSSSVLFQICAFIRLSWQASIMMTLTKQAAPAGC